MEITINDKTITMADGASLQEAMESQGIASQGIATAVNGTVVPAAERAQTKLNNGDKIVIIKAFYGG